MTIIVWDTSEGGHKTRPKAVAVKQQLGKKELVFRRFRDIEKSDH
jgi:hypothetical protein